MGDEYRYQGGTLWSVVDQSVWLCSIEQGIKKFHLAEVRRPIANNTWIRSSEKLPTKEDFPIQVRYGNGSTSIIKQLDKMVKASNLGQWIGRTSYWAPYVEPEMPPKTQHELDIEAYFEWINKNSGGGTSPAWHAALAYERNRNNKSI